MAEEMDINPESPASAPADAGQAQGQDAGQWFEALPEELTYEARGADGKFTKAKVRDSSKLKEFKDVSSLAQAFLNQEKLLGRKAQGLAVPGEGATAEEMAQFDKELRKALKVPEAADGYQIKVGDKAVPHEGLVAHAAAAAHKAGLTPGQLQAMYDAVDRFAVTAMEAQDKADSEAEAKAKAAVQGHWKGEAEANADLAKRGFEAAAVKAGVSAEEAKAFAETYGNNLTFLRVFHLLGKQMAEDGLIEGAAPGGSGNATGDGRTDFSKMFGSK